MLVTILLGGLVAGNGSPAATTSAPSARRSLASAEVVATVLGKPILREELSAPATSTQPAALAAMGRSLSRRIGKPLTDEFIRENHLETAPEEVKAAAEMIRQTLAAKRERDKGELADITVRLKSANLAAAERSRLSRRKLQLQTMLDFDRRLASRPDGKSEGVAEMMAAWQVPSWKLNRALYRKYGGTVIWQQAGLEAVDAMRMFLEEQEKAGKFAIYDPKLRDEFWKYYRQKHHPFVQKGVDPFEIPPWEADFAAVSRPATSTASEPSR